MIMVMWTRFYVVLATVFNKPGEVSIVLPEPKCMYSFLGSRRTTEETEVNKKHVQNKNVLAVNQAFHIIFWYKSVLTG